MTDTRDLFPKKIECNRCKDDFEPHEITLLEDKEYVCYNCMESQVTKELDEIRKGENESEKNDME